MCKKENQLQVCFSTFFTYIGMPGRYIILDLPDELLDETLELKDKYLGIN